MWTKYLPYHVARIRHLRKRLLVLDWHLTAIEIASKDALYPFPETSASKGDDYICLFSGKSYRALAPYTIHTTALRTIERLAPDVVIAPATPFPSGMASVKYSLQHNKISVMMDDAWELSDRRGHVVTLAKKIIHRNIDAVFIPAPSHAPYYLKMGFPKERIFYGVDAVDNNFFEIYAENFRRQSDALRRELNLPTKYFLFVGRFIQRKGIKTLLDAYRQYRKLVSKEKWGLVLVGEGDERKQHEDAMKEFPEVKFVGSQFGEDLCRYYALATAFVLPSELETWGLVVNEAMASGLPVLVSKGCGAGLQLVEEGNNGWTFGIADFEMLARLMSTMTDIPTDQLHRMGMRSKEIIEKWSLDTFADGVIAAASFPRRERGGIISYLVTKFWTGRISFYP
jgi:glycosyltransferase involved in cell wall biosynthesis